MDKVQKLQEKNWLSALRDEFPILSRTLRHGAPLSYLDNAASKQKPRAVLAAMEECYTRYYGNVHRGAHQLSAEATVHFEAARAKLQHFINAAHAHEIILTKGTTESINLVAASFGQNLKVGDAIVLSELEHHSNIVPWQLLRERAGIEIRVLPLLADGRVDADALDGLLADGKVKLVAVAHVSNAMGVINDVATISSKAHAAGAKVLLDGCQAVAHLNVDVQALNADFYVFSGHKMYGPSGIGVLYGKEDLLNAMPPYQGGGEMIDRVSWAKTTWAALPYKFEAGTPPIAEAIGLGAAVDFVRSLDRARTHAHEQALLKQAIDGLLAIEGLTIHGTAHTKVPVVSFTIEGVHHADLAAIVDEKGVAIRAGHHCAQPLMDWLGVTGTARASFACYNTEEEVTRLVEAVKLAKGMLA